MFVGPFSESIIKRAKEKGLVDIGLIDFRNFATNKHKTVDDTPYGGGPGMLIKCDVIDRALTHVRRQSSSYSENCLQDASIPKRQSLQSKKDCLYCPTTKVVLTAPSGTKFDQKKAYEYSKLDHLIIIAGHYEGFDQRIHDHLVDEEISIGDYVLSGGELPAMVIVDSIVRLLPGAIRPESLNSETFGKPDGIENCPEGVLSQSKEKLKIENSGEYQQYTRPAEYKGWKVPNVLISGNHAEIKKWREKRR